MPTTDGGRLHHDEHLLPTGPQPGRPDSQPPVTATEPNTPHADDSYQGSNLVAQGEVVEHQLALSLDERAGGAEETPDSG